MRLGYHVGGAPDNLEVVMRGTVGETLERLILLQIGAAAATRDRVQQIVDSLVEQGRVEREEGRTVVNDVMNRARERSTGARSLVDASLQQGLRRGGVPTREDYEDLLFRIEQLEHRVRMLEDRPAAPPPPAGEPESRAARSGNLRRFSQISRVLVRHGFGFVFDVRRDRREKKGQQQLLAPNFGVRLRRTLDDLGPTFVKFGQVLSTRSDILPEGVLSELQKLQDTATPMPAGLAQEIIEGELGAPVD